MSENMLRDELANALKVAMEQGDQRTIAIIRLVQAALKERDEQIREDGGRHRSCVRTDRPISNRFTVVMECEHGLSASEHDFEIRVAIQIADCRRSSYIALCRDGPA